MLNCHRSCFVVQIVTFLLCIAGVHAAMAQGTAGMFPQPITIKERDAIAHRLGLSSNVAVEFERLHKAYQEDLLCFREREIRQFLERDAIDPLSVINALPDDRNLEQSFARWKRIFTRFVLVEEKFFDGLHGLLDENQQAQLPGVRAARARGRFGQIRWLVSTLSPAGIIDLHAVIAECQLSEEDEQRLQPTLDRGNMKSIRLIEDAITATLDSCVEYVERMERAGWGEVPGADAPAGTNEAFRNAVIEAWNDARVEVREAARTLLLHDYSTVMKMAGELETDNAFTLYQQLSFAARQALLTDGWHRHVQQRIDWASARESTTAEEQAEIAQLRESYLTRSMAIFNEVAPDAIKVFAGLGYLALSQDHIDKVNAFQRNNQATRDWEQLKDDTLRQLGTIVGQSALAEFDEQQRQEQEARRAARESANDSILDGVIRSDEFLTFTWDQITRSEFDHFVKLLNLNDENARTAATLTYELYLQQLRAMREQEIEAMAAAPLMYVVDEERNELATPTADQIARGKAARHAAFAEYANIEKQFLDGLASLIDKDNPDQVSAMKLITAARTTQQLAEYRPSNKASGGLHKGHRGNVAGLLSHLPIDDASRTVAADLLTMHMPKLQIAAREHRKLDINYNETDWQVRAEVDALLAQDLSVEEAWAETDSLDLEKTAMRMLKLRQELIELNDAAINDLTTALNADDAQLFRHEYRVRTYPELFTERYYLFDGRSVVDLHKLLRPALNDPDRQNQATKLLLQWDDASAEMVDVLESASRLGMHFSEVDSSEERQHVEQELGRLDFIRKETETRAKQLIETAED